MKNVFYMHKLSSIGGVESFLYYLSQVYKDFVVYYKEADIEQVKRLAKNVEVHKYKHPIKCDRFFCNYGYDVEVEAEKYHIVHYDPLNVGFTPMQNIGFKYIGVSKVACKGYEEKTGNKCELIYNVIPIKKKGFKKYNGLNLISATRLTSEKGGKRINKLARMLDKAGVDYKWTIYTNRTRYKFESPNIIVKEQKLDIHDEIEKSSYLVQLSDCESFGLSVCESLILGTPVIITDLEAFKEIGCIHGKNSVIVNFDLTNVDIDMIVKNNMKFDYIPPKSNWDKYLSKTSDYNPNDIVKVKALKNIWLLEQDKHYRRHDIIEVPKYKASELECLGYAEVI